MGSFTRVLSTRGAQSEERTLSRGGWVSKYHGHIFYPLVPFARARQRTQFLLQPAPRVITRSRLLTYSFSPPRRTMRDKRDPSLLLSPVSLPPADYNHRAQMPRHSYTLIILYYSKRPRATCARTSLTYCRELRGGLYHPAETIVIMTQVKYRGLRIVCIQRSSLCT